MARKPVIKTSVDPKIKMQAKLNAEQLGISESAYVAMAVESEVSNFDYRKEMNKACENAVKAKEEQFKAETERDTALQERSEFKAKHEEAQEELNHIGSMLGDAPATKESVRERIDEANAVIRFYETRGFWARVFNRKPPKA